MILDYRPFDIIFVLNLLHKFVNSQLLGSSRKYKILLSYKTSWKPIFLVLPIAEWILWKTVLDRCMTMFNTQ